MRHASLFSGIGGFDLAAEWAGWVNVFNCEIDDFCKRVLKYHFPNAIQHEDIKATDFQVYRGRVDVLTGGFPCQPFSTAGKRKGADDDRYLWPEMLRAIREIRPTWVIGENVGGILSMVQPGDEVTVVGEASFFEENHKETLLEQEFVVESVCRDLEQEGYCVQPIVIPACGVGAPHRRDRVWFVAYRSDAWVEGVREERTDEVCGFKASSNSYGDRQRHRQDQQVSFERSDGASYDCDGSKDGVTSDSDKKRCKRWIESDRQESSVQLLPEGLCPRSGTTERRVADWSKFPSQSPVCGGDDGLPFDVDNLTISFSQWRDGLISAYGNAIVPQVAYEIFIGINKIKTL